jgi:excisionase family DNA binding protein
MLAANTLRKTTIASTVLPSAADISDPAQSEDTANSVLELHVDVKTAARFLGVSCSLVYSYVERKQIPHYRMMGRTIRFSLSELATWRAQFHVDGGINE